MAEQTTQPKPQEPEQTQIKLQFRQGDTIFEEKDKDPQVFIIKLGTVRLYKTKGDELVELAILKKGDFLGLISHMLNEGVYYCNAEAMDNVQLEIITDRFMDFDESAKEDPLLKAWSSFLVKSLKKSYETIKTLQYFEKIHYDHYKKRQIQVFHIKDFTKITTILMLLFNRYNQVVSRSAFEDTVFIVLSRVSIRLSDVIKIMEQYEILVTDEDASGENHYSLINSKKLEILNNYLRRNIIADPKQLILTITQYDCLTIMLHMMLKDWNEYDKLKEIMSGDLSKLYDSLRVNLPPQFKKGSFTFTKEELRLFQDEYKGVQTSSVPLEGLIEKGILRREYNDKGGSCYSVQKLDLVDSITFKHIIDALGRFAGGK